MEKSPTDNLNIRNGISKNYLDIFEVNLLILGIVNNGSQEVEETFVAFKSFKEIDQSFGSQLFVVFSSHLDANLKILTDVAC